MQRKGAGHGGSQPRGAYVLRDMQKQERRGSEGSGGCGKVSSEERRRGSVVVFYFSSACGAGQAFGFFELVVVAVGAD